MQGCAFPPQTGTRELEWDEESGTYVTPDGTRYTDEELDALSDMEAEWKEDMRRTLPASLHKLLEIFPEGREAAGRRLDSMREEAARLKASFRPVPDELTKSIARMEFYLDMFDGKLSKRTVAFEKLKDAAREVPIAAITKVTNRTARCPFHSDRKPSMYVYPPRDAGDREHYHCFVCGAHGDVISLYQQIHGLRFRDAVELLSKTSFLI